ncbi:hypothetical protein [Psychromonas hadalis]|uniref:hypothetical protein n=1 Tax=Psychromonas hadalis TaxID=211669 RepID=UPI001B7FCB83|nr:hypothetical protein [Psychromonas hadalis]
MKSNNEVQPLLQVKDLVVNISPMMGLFARLIMSVLILHRGSVWFSGGVGLW